MEIEPERKAGRPPNVEIRERRREEILSAAVKLFAENGYDRADTQVLADVLGIGKGTIYRYFPSKRELFLAAVDSAMRQLTAAVDESVEREEDPFRRMVCGIRSYLTFFAAHPELVELIIQERAQFKDRKKPTYFEYRDANRVRWREMFCSLIAEGRLRAFNVDRVLDVLGDMLYGTMFCNYFVARESSPDAQTQDILDIALHGILSDAERARWRSLR
jgi:AcrR family transcriptional regulator